MSLRTTRRTAAAAVAAAAAATVAIAVDLDMESGGEGEGPDVNQAEDEDEGEVSRGEDSESVCHAAYISDANVHLIRQKKRKKRKTVQR